MEITNSKIQITNKHQRPKIKFPNSCHRPIWLLVNLILGFVWDLGSGICIFCLLISAGCGDNPGYTNSSLYPENIGTVYVEMFDNQSFRRGVEYELTDALAKRIEAQSPYKIVTDRDKADSIISGRLTSVNESTLTTERQIGRALEKSVELKAVVTWKNLRTGEILIDNKTVGASAAFSEWQNQSFTYGATLAANLLAEKIVEQMESGW
jgi:hypothetical protein